jgi:hypothetical protein
MGRNSAAPAADPQQLRRMVDDLVVVLRGEHPDAALVLVRETVEQAAVELAPIATIPATFRVTVRRRAGARLHALSGRLIPITSARPLPAPR